MTGDVGEPARKRQKRQHKPTLGTKLARLPDNAKVQKRPLMRPSIPSAHAGASCPKVVYVGSKTPFLSAVKRVEKLLHFSDKRLIQSATKVAQHDSRRRRQRSGEDDHLEAVAEIAEEQKRKGAGEEVVVKGTGKAIAKVMDIALWFQQREQDYAIRLETSSVSSIDDVEYLEEGAAEGDVTEQTRIRKVSVLEVFVRLR